MKSFIVAVLVVVLAYFFAAEREPASLPQAPSVSSSTSSDQVLEAAFTTQRNQYQVQGTGEVSRILSDDNNGSRHQRFILRLDSGQTLLVAHNIDLAPRIDSLQVGDTVEFNGEYEWNAEGGVIHWTHDDPQGRHETGWLKHKGRTYQ